MKTVTSKTFTEEVLTQEKPTLVEIYTNSCPNCKVLEPIVDAVEKANSEHYNFYKLNAQENINIARKYKVLGVPTLLFFSHGILVDKKMGVLSQQKVEGKLSPLLAYSKEMALKKERKGYLKLPWKH